jgi:hypothetical protein
VLRAIYVEDDEKERLDVGLLGTLTDCWNTYSPHGPIQIEALDFPEARRRLQAVPDAVQLYIVDVLDARSTTQPKPGLQFIEQARRHSKAAIVAISEKPEELDGARNQGANDAISKVSISTASHRMTYDRLLKALREAGVSLGQLDHIVVDWDVDDMQISSVADTIGKEAVKELLAELVPGISGEVRLHFVRPGLSGAVVVHCECALDPAVRPGKTHVILKASRDRESMKAELARWPETMRFRSALFPALAHDALGSGDGWHALAITHFSGLTLTSWLHKGQDTTDVERVLSQLWLEDGLARVYADSSPKKEEGRPTAAIRDGTLGLGRRARVAAMCERLGPLARRHAGATDETFALVGGFLRHGTFAGIDADEPPSGCWLVRSHGDLHGRNLLVNRHGTVMVIDPASIDARHWAIDYARLTVDILLAALAQDPEGHEWDLMVQWLELAGSLVAGEPSANTDVLPPRVAAALDWLADKRNEIFAGVGTDGTLPIAWELELAIAAELLRAVYRVEELPSPVRVLGLAAGAAALQTSAASYRTACE